MAKEIDIIFDVTADELESCLSVLKNFCKTLEEEHKSLKSKNASKEEIIESGSRVQFCNDALDHWKSAINRSLDKDTLALAEELIDAVDNLATVCATYKDPDEYHRCRVMISPLLHGAKTVLGELPDLLLTELRKKKET